MRSNSHIIQFLKKAKDPLLLESNAFDSLTSIAGDPAIFIKAGENWQYPAYMSEDPKIISAFSTTNPYIQLSDNIAIVSLSGPLANDPSCMQEMAGWSSTAAVRNALKIAYYDPNVKSILLNINSPGGEVDGTDATASLIQEISKKKKVHGYVSGMMASAAAWIGSATQKISSSPTAEIGSIGVVFTLVDDSAKMEKDGYKRKEIVSDVSPDKRIDANSEEGEAYIRTRANDIAQIFVDRISSMRNVPQSHVLEHFGKGRVMIASKALEAKMIDAISTLDEAILELKNLEERNTGGTMDISKLTAQELKDQNPALYEQIQSEAKSISAEAEFQKGVQAESKRVNAILSKAQAGYGDVTKKHLQDPNSTFEAYLSELVDAKASTSKDFLSNLKNDASGVNDLGAETSKESKSITFEESLAALAKETIKNPSRGVGE